MTVGTMMPAHDDRPAASRQETIGRLALVILAFAVLAWWSWALAVFAVALILSIVLHELGHYLGAKWGGMKPTEFFIGFGPRIFSFRRGDTEFGMKPILLGAYVKVPGMHNLEDVDPADEPRTYRAQSYGRRARMVVAGPAMNLAVALVGFIGFFTFFDEPKLFDTGTPAVSIGDDIDASPAGLAGVRDGDRVLAVDGQTFTGIESIVTYVRARPGQTATLSIERDGAELAVPVTLGDRNPTSGEAVGYLGLRFLRDNVPISRNSAEAVQRGFEEFGSQVGRTVVGIGRIFSPAGLADLFEMVTGQQQDDPANRPVSIVGIGEVGADVVESGLADTVIVVASLNLALGLFNLLPILPFDGGHLLIATYERIRSRRGTRYSVDFAKVMPYFAPLVMVVLFVVFSALYLDIRS